MFSVYVITKPSYNSHLTFPGNTHATTLFTTGSAVEHVRLHLEDEARLEGATHKGTWIPGVGVRLPVVEVVLQ